MAEVKKTTTKKTSEVKTTTKSTTKAAATKTVAKTATKKVEKPATTKAEPAKKATVAKKAPAVKKTPAVKKAEAVEVKTEEVKAPAKKPVAKKVGKQIKVTLVKSTIGYDKKQAKIVKALGLGKLNSTHVLPDNACVRGMINKISHLVKVEELN